MHQPGHISRRVFLARAGGLTLTLGAPGLVHALSRRAADPYARGVWLAGDHHIHTKYSPDGQYQIGQQVANARKYGLDWCAITDHGGPHHDKVSLQQAYPELLDARRKNPAITVFQGMEWNIPAAEHGSVIIPPSADEADVISKFEAAFDERNLSRPEARHSSEADAVAAVKYLESLSPQPIFMANHPARRGLDSPHEMRAWSDAGPNVARGFEGAPGHAACTLIGKPRGEYDKSPNKDSWPGYPEDSYRTWGGYDWYVAKVGGLWDSLLGEGRRWYITSNSDSHRHYTDRMEVDVSTYLTRGYVTEKGGKTDHAAEGDFYPGEYSKTWVFANSREPMAIIDALREGRMFTVLGGLISRLELTARSTSDSIPMGGTLLLDRSGSDVTITINIREAEAPNRGGVLPEVHHVDMIAGDILGPNMDRDSISNPTTRAAAQFERSAARHSGPWLSFSHRFSNVRKSFYVRVRGTNSTATVPRMDHLTVNPWIDLWFYSNPIFVHV